MEEEVSEEEEVAAVALEEEEEVSEEEDRSRSEHSTTFKVCQQVFPSCWPGPDCVCVCMCVCFLLTNRSPMCCSQRYVFCAAHLHR
jgi:hypothetical protein